MRYAAALEAIDVDGLPPVEQWRPDHIAEIDIVIRADGVWVHEGAPIRRARLVRLFSTILRKEGEDYFLVAPAEKLKIRVEDAPFIAVAMRVEDEAGEEQRIYFRSNLGDEALASADHPIRCRKPQNASDDAPVPYIDIRNGLEARIARAIYYDLVALGEIHQIDGEKYFGVWSDGRFFPMAPGDDFAS